MDVIKNARVGPEQTYLLRIPDAEAVLGDSIMERAVDLVASGIANDFLRERGAEIVASIGTKLVLNLAVAEVVKRIGSETTKTVYR